MRSHDQRCPSPGELPRQIFLPVRGALLVFHAPMDWDNHNRPPRPGFPDQRCGSGSIDGRKNIIEGYECQFQAVHFPIDRLRPGADGHKTCPVHGTDRIPHPVIAAVKTVVVG